jgi:3-oxoacyl-[acyl-carrier protein] reductase
LLSDKALKTAWITGASGDIGTAISAELAQNNWKIIGMSREDLDLADPKSTEDWIERNKNQVPDLIVCNAGGNVPKSVFDSDIQDFEFGLRNNFLGHVAIIQSVVKGMRDRGSGSIIFISSAYSTRSKKGRSQYSVSKSAQDAYMRSLALELGPFGIKVNSISPGFMETKLTRKNNSAEQVADIISGIPMQRLGTPNEVAVLLGFLASDKNTYITGQNIAIDGGFLLQ